MASASPHHTGQAEAADQSRSTTRIAAVLLAGVGVKMVALAAPDLAVMRADSTGSAE